MNIQDSQRYWCRPIQKAGPYSGSGRGALDSWMLNKTLVIDNKSNSVVAWFQDGQLAEAFCKSMNAGA